MKERSPGLCHAAASLSLAPHSHTDTQTKKNVTRTTHYRSPVSRVGYGVGVSALFCHLLFTRELLYFTQAP